MARIRTKENVCLSMRFGQDRTGALFLLLLFLMCLHKSSIETAVSIHFFFFSLSLSLSLSFVKIELIFDPLHYISTFANACPRLVIILIRHAGMSA